MQSNWQETFFRGVALDGWRRILNPEMTRTEVDLLERVLGVESGARLLDVPCGNGRHAIELASRGYNMTGLDLRRRTQCDISPGSMGEGRYALTPQGIRV
jgi:2-polyprenyl-3-methyl-5-hydroxy-6-metoxy-1,4-benzoquinol methylase